MNDSNPPLDGQGDTGNAQVAAGLVVPLGSAQPPSLNGGIPVLMPRVQGMAGNAASGQSTIAEGLIFTGNASLSGPCSVAGTVVGNLVQAGGASISVVITETGEITGDVRADKISVMGMATGTLDASGGQVALLDSASVTGLVRYERIQVNGADLNATLERVGGQDPARARGARRGG